MFKRFRHGPVSPLEAELMAARPEPSARLVDSIVGLARPRASSRPSRLRLGYAAVLTAAMVAVLAATGGLAYAASAIHLTSSPASHSPRSAACSQYARAPRISNRKPGAGKVGSNVTISGSNFSGDSKVTSVKFGGGKSASFRVSSNTKLTAKVPKGAKTGGITVTNCAGSATSPKFTVKK